MSARDVIAIAIGGPVFALAVWAWCWLVPALLGGGAS